MERNIKPGDIVSHFKRDFLTDEEKGTGKYLYQVLAFAEHTETGEKLVVYRALYGDGQTFARPYDMFMGKVDKEKYPESNRTFRFEAED